MFALVDCNNFFVSCERVFNPQLWGKPVGILSNNDGCIVARSNELKQIGVPMGAPYHEWSDLINRHDGIMHSGNFPLYSDLSNRVMAILRAYAPACEVYSVDEAFLDLSGLSSQQFALLGQQMHAQVAQWVGIPISIGIAPSKTLAKLANAAAKCNPNLNNVCVLATATQQQQVLQQTPLTDLWGINERLAKRYHRFGIGNADDLRRANRTFLRQHFTVTAERLWYELNGLPAHALGPAEHSPRHAIICSRTFGRKIQTLAGLKQAVATYVERACRKLQRTAQLSSCINVYIKTNKFNPYDSQYRNNFMLGLPVPTADTGRLIRAAWQALSIIYIPGYQYHKAGISLHALCPANAAQPDLSAPAAQLRYNPKHGRLRQTIHALNTGYGYPVIHSAASGIKPRWHKRCELQTPAYTTHWEDLPKVR